MTTFLTPWLTHPLSLALGRALLHFVWQGAAVWLVAAACAYGLRRTPASRRYDVLLLLFALMSVLPVVSLFVLAGSAAHEETPSMAGDVIPESAQSIGVDFSIVESDRGTVRMVPEFVTVDPQEPPAEEIAPVIAAEPSSFHSERFLPWFVAAWLLGVAGSSLRLWAGFFGVVCIRWCGRSPAPAIAEGLCRELRQRLGVTRAVQVYESLLVQTPVVVGWLKPLIFFPVGMITGLDEAQLRALLAHELAHLRRHDYLVNIFQTVVETLLFYHPAVWWLSRRLRQERELCCDDIVVQVTGDRLIYARTLTDLAGRAASPALTAAATDGHLLTRIRHILGIPAPRPTLLSGHWAAVVLIVLLAGGGMVWQVSVAANQTAEDIADESETQANSVEEVDEESEKPAIVEFSDGRSVEFVGITKNTAPASEGWQPNGLPLGDVGYWKSTTVLHNGNTSSSYTENGEHPEPDANAIDFLFRFRGLKAQPSLKFHLPTNGSNYSHWPVQDPYELRVSTRKREAPLPGAQWQPPDGVVHVGFTDEPWGRYVKISPAGEFLNPIQPDELYATTYALITVLGTRPHDRAPGQSVIVMREPSDNTDPADNWHQYDVEFRAVDTDDKPHWALAWNSTSSVEAPGWQESQYGLSQPLPEGKKLSHYEFRLRPYRQWATFENVSLEPGERTQVRAASALVSDAEVLAHQFAQALRRQGVPYLDDAQIQFLSRSLHDGIAPRLKSPLSVNRRQQLAAAVSAYIQREFDPAEKDALYLEFQNRFQTLKWVLGLALEQPELTADEIVQLDRQRQWMRAEIEKLPELTKFRLWHEDELAKLESLFDDPLNPFFVRPMPDDAFALFQAAYQKKMEGNRSETRLVFAATWLFQAAWTVQRDGLLQKYPMDNIGSGVHNLRWSLTVTRHPGNVALDVGDRRKQVRDIYVDVMKMIFVPGDAPANQDDRAKWLREQGQGDLAFDGKDRALVGMRGAKLAVLEATDWQSADQTPLATLEHLLETSGQDFVSLSTFVEPDGDPANGIQKLRAAAPSLAIRTNEGQIAVIRLLSMSGDTPVIRSRARPLPPNLPLHPGDVVAMKSADEEGDPRLEERPAPIPDTGTLSGRFLFDGPPPAPRDFSKFYENIAVGKPLPRDEFGRQYGAHMGYLAYLQKNLKPNLEDRSLLVDPKGGIANVLIWVTSKNIPVTAQEELPPAIIDVRNGSFSPDITVLRTGQTLQLENHDPVGVNISLLLNKNPWINPLLTANNVEQPFTTTFAKAESYPVRVQSNVVMWSTAWVMIRDNSYIAVSRPDGTFTIPNLPPGEWEFRVWHERAGYIKHWPKGQFRQKIQPGENSLDTIKLNPELFETEKPADEKSSSVPLTTDKPIVAEAETGSSDPEIQQLPDEIPGTVVDKDTGQAIAGATVRFRFLKIRREPGEPNDVPPELVFRDVGKFTFTLPDGITDPKYYLLERSAEHPDYQTLGQTMISLSDALNGEPKHAHDFLRRIELAPGAVVTGKVIDLDGKPARGVPVFSGDNRQGYQNGGLHKTVTDADGRFRLVVPRRNPNYRGRIYLVPTHAAAVSRAITESYGEQEVYQLRRGTRVKGRVVDDERNGVPGVVVRANAGERIPYRYATTDADGRYELPPCAYGDYVVELLDDWTVPGESHRGARLPAVYLGQKLSLSKDAPAEHVLDFEPVDSVRVTARGVNNDETPAVDLNLTVGGARKGGPYWRGKLRPIADEPGRYQVRVPRELQQLRIEREMGPGTFLRIPNNWIVKLDENFEGFEVRQFKAARVTFRATLDGRPFDLRAFKYNVPWPGSISPWPRFADVEAARQLGAVQPNSMGLEKLADGTLRINVHPEIDLVVNFEGPGFKPQLVNFWLKEGEERTIDVHLESLTPAKGRAEGDVRSEEQRGQETRAERDK